jgi:hypothetical protein
MSRKRGSRGNPTVTKIESETHNKSPQPSPRKPLTLATIPYRGRWYHRTIIFALNLLLLVLGFVGYVVLRTPVLLRKFRGPASTIFWRGATLLTVSYLVYDRIYETGATISSPPSDSTNPIR